MASTYLRRRNPTPTCCQHRYGTSSGENDGSPVDSHCVVLLVGVVRQVGGAVFAAKALRLSFELVQHRLKQRQTTAISGSQRHTSHPKEKQNQSDREREREKARKTAWHTFDFAAKSRARDVTRLSLAEISASLAESNTL